MTRMKRLHRSFLALRRLDDRCLPSSVQGAVFDDANRDQTFNVGETGLADWTVFLDLDQDDLHDAGEPLAVTDLNGAYTLDTSGVVGQWHRVVLDLQVGTGGRWLDTSAKPLLVDALNGQGGANLGVTLEPYVNVEPDGSETRINLTTAGEQSYSTVAADAAGNYVVAWRSAGVSSQTVFARMFYADGTPRTGEITVVTGTNIQLPQVEMADNGRFAVAWSSAVGSAPWSVFTRVYAANGSPQTGVITVAAAKPNVSHFVQGIAMDADGDFAVLYWSNHPSLTIKVQRYTAAGTANGKAIEVTNPNLVNGRNCIVMDDAGNFVVVWENVSLLAQRYGANGKAIGSQIVVSNGPSGEDHLTVTMNSSGQWAVHWYDFALHRDRIRLMQANGAPAGPITDLTAGASGMAIDDAGTVTLAWTDAHSEVRFRRFTGGVALEPEYVVNTTTAGRQDNLTEFVYPNFNAGLTATGIDRFMVTWQGNGPGDDQGVFAQRFGPMSAPRPGINNALPTLWTSIPINPPQGLHSGNLEDGKPKWLALQQGWFDEMEM